MFTTNIMRLEELKVRLADLDTSKSTIEYELQVLNNGEQHVEQLK
jgi:hypothetical protein